MMVGMKLQLLTILFIASLPLCIVATLAAGCAWDKPNPSAFQDEPGYPCGHVGVVCTDKTSGKPNGMCCNEGETCGDSKGSVGCPPGSCCDIRMPPAFMVRHPQTDAGIK